MEEKCIITCVLNLFEPNPRMNEHQLNDRVSFLVWTTGDSFVRLRAFLWPTHRMLTCERTHTCARWKIRLVSSFGFMFFLLFLDFIFAEARRKWNEKKINDSSIQWWSRASVRAPREFWLCNEWFAINVLRRCRCMLRVYRIQFHRFQTDDSKNLKTYTHA